MSDGIRKNLTGNAIKWIAILTMLIDHIAWAFVPMYSAPGQFMHIIGRITAPTMCFFIAEGYAHTRDVKKYALRLGVFAVFSQVPFTMFEAHQISFYSQKAGFSVIYTLLLSLLAVWAWDSIKNSALKYLAVIGLCILAIPGDWGFMDVLFTLIFWNYRNDRKNYVLWFSVLTAGMVVSSLILLAVSGKALYSQLFQLGVLLCLPILSLYNGERGGNRNSKWIFYIFYPFHLLILALIKMYL